MIEPTYRRDQLWGRPRRGVHGTIVLGACAGIVLAITALVAAPRAFVFHDDSRRDHAERLVATLAQDSFSEWREHHAGCPHRLSNLLANARLDPWGRALHYTCDPRLGPGAHFTVISAGEDGRFGTADDIEAHQ